MNMRAFLNPFSRFMAKFNDKTKDIGFICGFSGLILLYFLCNGGVFQTRYLIHFVIGCFFLGIMILCCMREDISKVSIKINKPFFIVWMLYGGVQLISGIINTVDWLPEAMLILVAYPIFFWVLNSWNINKAFSMLSKVCIASFVPFLVVSFLFFPLVSEQYKGMFTNQNGVGQYLSVVLCCLMIEIFEGTHSKKGHLVYNIIMAGASCAILMYSGSRTGMSAVLVVFASYLILRCIKKGAEKKELFKRMAVLIIVCVVSYFSVAWFFSLRQYLPLPFYDNEKNQFYFLDNDLEWGDALKQINETNAQKLDFEGKDIDTISSGRSTIWKTYIKELNLRGHSSSGELFVEEFVDIPWRSNYTSTAHNFLLQQSYNHGILAGIISLILNIYGGILAVTYALRKNGPYSAMPLLIILAFGVTSLLASLTTSFHYLILLYYFFMHAPLLMERK